MPLCSVCDALDLTDKARDIDIHNLKAHNQDLKPARLGLYDEIATKADDGCGACQFFQQLLDSSYQAQASKLTGYEISLDMWGLQTQSPKDRAKGRTTSAPSELQLDQCKPEDYAGDDDLDLDCRRLVPIDPMTGSCIDLVRSWLHECSGHSCTPQAEAVLPHRVLEISSDPAVNPRLRVFNGSEGQYNRGKYLALSHCWGGGDIAKLTTENLARYQETIDINTLPKNLQDAVTVTRALGFRYLWIDALCIIQDDPRDWEEESMWMATIYGHSTITISATEAKDSNSGFLTDRHVSYSPALGIKKDRYLRQRLLRWQEDIDHAPLSRRGWAAQERILAPRVLHYTKRQMMWECAETWHFEASGIADPKRGSGQRREKYRKDFVQPLVNESIVEHKPSVFENEDVQQRRLDADNLITRLEAWHQCVDEFSSRDLTRTSDKLPAMAGLAQAISDGSLGDYLAGIWSRDISLGLAWSRVFQVLTKPPVYRAPSWSWASLDGAVSSLILYWSPERLRERLSDPTFVDPYEVKLIEQNLVWEVASNPYMGLLEGSHIVVEGSCRNLMDVPNQLADHGFQPTLVLDRTDVFDCQMCASGRDHSDDEGGKNLHKDLDKQVHDLKTYICMVVRWDGWRTPDSDVFTLLLKPVDEAGTTFERVGCMKLDVDIQIRFNSFDTERVNSRFDDLGWERRTLKLI